MDAKRFVIGTVGGAVALYVVGYLMFTLAFAAFYRANAGSATGVDRDGELMWAVMLASLAYAALITFAMGNQAAPRTIVAGSRIGAIVGFLLWFTADFVFYGISNIANLTRTIVDPLLEIVHGGIGGAIIAVVLARVPMASVRPQVRT